jgi:phenylacetate-CoA ligase
MGVRSVNVGLEGGSEAVLRFAELTRAETLVATPSLLEYLVERSPEILGKPIGALPIRRLISGGEPGAGLPETRQMLVTTFDAELFDFIGPTSQFGYVSCLSPEYQGMHNVAADLHVWAEDLVDPETKEPIDVTDGVIGEGYMTDLAREAGPVLKYAYGDILQVFTEPCGCGLPGNRIKMLSRADDMLIVKGVNVYPSAVKSVIEGFQPRTTGAMRIVLTQPPPMVPPPLRLVVELGGGTDQQDQSTLRDHIRAKLHYQLRFTPEIDFVAANTLHRSEKKTDLFDRRYVRDQ